MDGCGNEAAKQPHNCVAEQMEAGSSDSSSNRSIE